MLESAGRRRFLVKGAFILAGGLFGGGFRSRAHAFERLAFPMPQPPGPVEPSPCGPRAAVIIDDIGNSITRARDFLDLQMPLTFSILPQLPHSPYIAEEVHGRGQEIMLHQPMEPYCGDMDPGPGALYVNSPPGEIERIIERNLGELPPLAGVNNHMGSRFTSSPAKVDQALRVMKERDLFFIDSVTSNRSIAYETARRLHMRAAYRNIFLDTSPHERWILRQLKRLEEHASLYGVGIGIGHPHEVTLRALDRYNRERFGGRVKVSLVHASDLLCHIP